MDAEHHFHCTAQIFVYAAWEYRRTFLGGGSMLDLLIRGGTIVDGTGGPAYPGDVGIEGDRIVAVGRIEAEAAQTVEAEGRSVAPGLVDIHTHSDYSLLLNRNAESSVRQGVTTELVGNCGFSAAPLASKSYLPMVVLEYLEGPVKPWRTFAEWTEVLESDGVSINVAGLVGHGPVRLAAMGTDARQATASEIREMARLVDEALADGAYGFSTGLEYNPGKNATFEEVASLCEVVGRRGRLYTTHIRNRDYTYLDAIEESLNVARQAQVRLQISHISPRWGVKEGAAEQALETVERAQADGVDVAFDNHPYTFGRGQVLSALPPWAFEGGVAALKTRLEDPAQRARIRAYENPQWKHVHQGRWDLLTMYDVPANPALEGQTVETIARSTDQEPWDVVCDLLLDEWEAPNRLRWSAPIHRQEHVDTALRQPRCAIMSDGCSIAPWGPYRNSRGIYAYGWASNVLRRYVRERRILSLEAAIHKMSGLPAARLGLSDRGTIAAGKRADLMVFDPDRVADTATFEHPIAFPVGIELVLVNGKATVRNGEHTGVRAGRVLRAQG